MDRTLFCGRSHPGSHPCKTNFFFSVAVIQQSNLFIYDLAFLGLSTLKTPQTGSASYYLNLILENSNYAKFILIVVVVVFVIGDGPLAMNLSVLSYVPIITFKRTILAAIRMLIFFSHHSQEISLLVEESYLSCF